MVVWVPVGVFVLVVVRIPVGMTATRCVITIVAQRVTAGVMVVLGLAKTNVEEGVWGLVQAVKVDAQRHVMVLVRMDVKIGVALLVSQNV